MAHRKKPFSGKKKKVQLQEKKARYWLDDPPNEPATVVPSMASHFVPSTGPSTDFGYESLHAPTQKLFSRFEKLDQQAIQKARLASMQPLHRLDKTALEMGFSETYLEFPKRPAWNYDMTKTQLEQQEEDMFEGWKEKIYTQVDDKAQLSWFEQNLQVWRQLWRVLEISDVVVLVMDIRNPVLHFPVPLYHYITRTLGRKMVGVFNKIDLVSDFTVFAWQQYFKEQFPDLHLATFSCFPRDSRLVDDTVTYALKQRVKRPRKRYYSAQGVQDVLRACQRATGDTTQDWDGLIKRYTQQENDNDENDDDDDDDGDDDASDTSSTAGIEDIIASDHPQTPHRDYITIGLVGHPNVGKSSLVNSLMHRTVVSTSRTPGHTKHFQTIHLSDRIRLCDSPGLVFPSLVPRSLQILSGMYPIAQVQEPYSVIEYLAERIPLESILGLLPSSTPWSAWTICEAYAEQRGYYTAKAARPDAYRAANAMLRLATDGRILLSFKPPGFFETTKYEKLRVLEADRQADNQDDDDDDDDDENSGSDDDGDDGGAIKTTEGQFALLAVE